VLWYGLDVFWGLFFCVGDALRMAWISYQQMATVGAKMPMVLAAIQQATQASRITPHLGILGLLAHGATYVTLLLIFLLLQRFVSLATLKQKATELLVAMGWGWNQSLKHFYLATGLTLLGVFGLFYLQNALLYQLTQNWHLHVPMPSMQSLKHPEMLLLASLFAPIEEELIYRGLFLGAFLQKFSLPVALFLSCGLFTVVHLNYWAYPFHLIVVALLGGLLGWVRIKTGSLWPGMIAHMANNGWALACLMT
jgi:membrane protease YdiL (CAAX protease family)